MPGAVDIERHDLRPEVVVGLGQGSACHQRTGVVDEHVQAAEKPHRFIDDAFAFRRCGEIRCRMSVASGGRPGFNLQCAGRIGAAAIVNEDVAAGREQLAADGETDTLGAGGDQRAPAEKFMHGRPKVSAW